MHSLLDSFFSAAGRIVLGKPAQIKLAMCCLLARGHLLIEDVPGVGKTTLAHSLAHLLGLQYQRVQFTSDLLPADILGSTVFDAAKQTFTFHPARCSAKCCWRTKSTAPRPSRKAPCWRPWRKSK
nr:AAA family ATPase [Methylogaea oryzae]